MMDMRFAAWQDEPFYREGRTRFSSGINGSLTTLLQVYEWRYDGERPPCNIWRRRRGRLGDHLWLAGQRDGFQRRKTRLVYPASAVAIAGM